MTELLYLADSYIGAFDAHVTEFSENGALVLDRTACYPTGGGQPHDTGTLSAGMRRWVVSNVARRGDDVLHYVDGRDAPAVGDRLHGDIDWPRRYRLMRTHTALHVLCGVVFR